jgi:hypothetical protein
MIRVLSVDDHLLLRGGIAALVNAESDMKLVAEATNGQDANRKVPLAPAGCDVNGSPDARPERHQGNHAEHGMNQHPYLYP